MGRQRQGKNIICLQRFLIASNSKQCASTIITNRRHTPPTAIYEPLLTLALPAFFSPSTIEATTLGEGQPHPRRRSSGILWTLPIIHSGSEPIARRDLLEAGSHSRVGAIFAFTNKHTNTLFIECSGLSSSLRKKGGSLLRYWK